VAKAMGAGRPEQAATAMLQSALLALVLAIAVILLHPLWLELGFTLMAPRPELTALAGSYVAIRIYSAPAVLVTYAVIGWFIGRQNTRWPMAILIVTNSANIGLDFLLIVGLGLNSDGAALATLIAEYLGCGIALWAVLRQPEARPAPGVKEALTKASAYTQLLRNNRHLFVRTVCLLFSFAFFTAAGEKLGTDVLAANTLLLQLLLMSAYAMDGFAYAAEGLTGHHLGAGDLQGFYRAVRHCAVWCLLAGVLISLCYGLFQRTLLDLLTDIPAVRELMQAHLPWLVALPLIAAPSYLLDGVFIGTAETRPMMLTMLVSTFCVYLPLWYLTRAWGNHGLWFAFVAFNAFRGMTLYYCYIRQRELGRWLRQPDTATI
jgi:MATE family multidrug resistance protein